MKIRDVEGWNIPILYVIGQPPLWGGVDLYQWRMKTPAVKMGSKISLGSLEFLPPKL